MYFNKEQSAKMLEIHATGDIKALVEFIEKAKAAKICPACKQEIHRKYAKRDTQDADND